MAGVSPAVGSRWFRDSGGMPPSCPTSFSGRYLSFIEREEIAVLNASGSGVNEIARRLGRSPSTISRELRRNAATRSGGFEYRATNAQWHADRRARRPKVAKLVTHDALRQYVQERLAGTILSPAGRVVPGPPGDSLDRPAPRAPPGPSMGTLVEPGADREQAASRLLR